MARLGRSGFVTLAVIFHLVYMASIFDIYFVSPIVHGMKAHRIASSHAPAKRLVLYVGDGLRADKAFQSFPDPSPEDPSNPDLTPRPLAPFLRSRVLEHGTFGVSHTRVPTESRPGHVALIAGLYEDVSAVTKGWKHNPVNFDSVFNRSRHTWSWGSPDILPMFQDGAVPGRVDADQYGSEFEDFTMSDATMLDIWVFDRVKQLFADAKTNATLNAQLREDKLVFFLHLLGLDTNGHAFRPYSKEYLNNIKVVDRGVEEITKLVEDFYGDGQTAFVFTADHGMHDLGSHGDGHPDNTRTPLIAWGSGVAKPVISGNGIAPGHEDTYSSDWGLDKVQRHDVEQADVAALMAYLAGLEFPVNSVGALPLSYLDATKSEKAQAALVNIKQILEMYGVKDEQKRSTSVNYKPYPPFAQLGQTVPERLAGIQNAINAEEHDHAIQLSSELMKETIQGLRYLQIYDWLFLRTLVTLGYIGWIVYGLISVINIHVLHGSSSAERSITSTILFSSVLVALYSFLIVEKSPFMYYLYAIFPVFFWEEVFARRYTLITGLKVLFGDGTNYVKFGIQSFFYVATLIIFVQSYHYRSILTVCYLVGALWPMVYGMEFVKKNVGVISAWVVGCIVLSNFTLLNVVKIENADTITIGGMLMLGVGVLYLSFEERITASSRSGRGTGAQSSTLSRIIMGLQVGLILLTILVTRSSVASIQAKKGLPLGNQVLGWFVLVVSFILPFVHRLAPNSHYLHRLVVIFLTFAPCFVILTISYEGIFYAVFCITLLTWNRLEHAVHLHLAAQKSTPSATTITSLTPDDTDVTNRTTYRTLTLADFRTSLFFLFLLQSAFFSTGNMASVSTFSLDAVYRLIPVFDPFSQGALLILKIMTPFAVISAVLGVLNRRLGLQSSALFMVIICISDIMTLNFFWMVKDEGSWLEIGMTISHFIIGSSLCVFVAMLEGLSEMLISGIQVDDNFEERIKKKGGVEKVNGSVSAKKGKKAANGTANGGVKRKASPRGEKRPVID